MIVLQSRTNFQGFFFYESRYIEDGVWFQILDQYRIRIQLENWKDVLLLVVHTVQFFLSLGFFSEKDSFFSFFSNDSFDRDRGLEKCNIYNDISRRVS